MAAQPSLFDSDSIDAGSGTKVEGALYFALYSIGPLASRGEIE